MGFDLKRLYERDMVSWKFRGYSTKGAPVCRKLVRNRLCSGIRSNNTEEEGHAVSIFGMNISVGIAVLVCSKGRYVLAGYRDSSRRKYMKKLRSQLYPAVESQRLLLIVIFSCAAIDVHVDDEVESPAQVAIWDPVVRALYKSTFASVLFESRQN
jgi:hypothetical protein